MTAPADRDIAVVIDQMLIIIPSYEAPLREALERVRRDSLYTAPEIQWTCWRMLRDTLIGRFGAEPKHEWPQWEERARLVFLGQDGPDGASNFLPSERKRL